MRILIFVVALLGFSLARADTPRLANQVPFQVPLNDGHIGSAVLLAGSDGQVMVVAAEGNPPVLSLYHVATLVQPTPDPGPNPNPNPNPTPLPQGPFTVIWIEESADRTPDQAKAITDSVIRETLKKAGWKLRVADVDVVDESGNTPEDLAPMVEAAKRLGVPRVFVIDAKGAEVFNGKAPQNRDEFIALLRRFGLVVSSPSNQCSSGNCVVRPRFRIFR